MTTPHLSRPRRPLRKVRPLVRQTRLWDQPLNLSRLNAEVVAYAGLVALSLLLHLWALGAMAMHHDESLHAWFSWKFFTGGGNFNCWSGQASTYCYDPVFHGPTLYLLTYASYFLFGVSEATARLPMALAGIGLIASCWWLRPLVGRRAALISAVLLLISPSVLYFTRFARHDALAVLWTFWIMVGLFRYFQDRQGRWLYLAAAGTALLWATHELVFIILFIVATFLIQRLMWERLSSRGFVIGSGIGMVVFGALMLFNPSISLPVATGQAANIFHFGGLALVVFMTLLIGQIISLRWTPTRLVGPALGEMVRKGFLWRALLVFLVTFTVCFTTFFTYPRGFFDGIYAGLAYWLLSQHAYGRGDQPWYYYFMQLSIYEILPIFLTLVGFVGWLGRVAWRKTVVSAKVWDEDDPGPADPASGPVASVALPALADQPHGAPKTVLLNDPDLLDPAPGVIDPLAMPLISTHEQPLSNPNWLPPPLVPIDEQILSSAIEPDQTADSALPLVVIDEQRLANAAASDPSAEPGMPLVYASSSDSLAQQVPAAPELAADQIEKPTDLWVGYMFYWFLLALTVFSWAGEKMPWLVVHMAVPAILAGAWALDRIIQRIDWPAMRQRLGWMVLPITIAIVVLLLRAQSVWSEANRAGDPASQAALELRLTGFTTLIFAGVAMGGLVALGYRLSRRQILPAISLSLVVLLSAYTVRATSNMVYRMPDTPREFLVYTQTSPDVPVIVEQIRRIAVTQTRNNRSVTDPTGGHSMKILLSSGDSATGNSEGSLRWPLEWYFRGWTNIQWVDKAQIANLSAEQLDAPVAIFTRSNMAPDTGQKMEAAGYIEAYNTIFNWWFPENGADNKSGYKDRLYDPEYGCDPALRGQQDSNQRALWRCRLGGASILTWPFRPANWDTLRKYMMYRELPPEARLSGREMVVYIKRNLAPNPGDASSATQQSGLLKLVSELVLGGTQPEQPRGIATGPDGAVYIADATANQILVYQVDGTTRVISGTGESALLEPSGVAVDQAGNVFVADTWHARVAKFDAAGRYLSAWGVGEEELGAGTGKFITRTDGSAAGNAAKPLGFFGPRGIAVDQSGHVFIADTGNKRVVVTDSAGNFIGQVGTPGAGPGQFNEPIGVAVDGEGNLYVADTWNSRVQVFAIGADGVPNPTPKAVWSVNGWRTSTYLDPFLAVSPDGRVVVTVPELNQATLYDSAGKPLITWGGKGADDSSLDGPSGVSFAPDGSVYIAEKANRRVQLWRLPRVR